MPDIDRAQCRVLLEPSDLDAAVSEALRARQVSVEAVTEGGEAGRLRLTGLAFSDRPGRASYVPLSTDAADGPAELPGTLDRLLGGDGPPKVAHDAKRALVALRRAGADLEPLALDTLLAAFLLGEESLDLESLAASRLGAAPPPSGEGESSAVAERAAGAACARTEAALRLADVLEPELQERGLLSYLRDLELPLVPVLADMELAGIRVDTAALATLSRNLNARLAALEAEMAEVAGIAINPRSPQQLRDLLFDRLHLPPGRKTSSGPSTDVHALEALADRHPVVGVILEHRQLAKLKDTYVDALPPLIDPDTDRVHTHFSQTGTSTGRLTSSGPNLQNLPVRTELGRRVRRAFVAGDPGGVPTVFLSADYSQIELRVLAHLSGEPMLRAAFAHGDDVHALTAARLYAVAVADVTPEMRRVGKAVNYGVIYGLTGYRLARDTGLDRGMATTFVRRHADLYPAVGAHVAALLRRAEETGYVETPLGRRRAMPDLRSPNRQRLEAARRAAQNMPNQGMTAEIIKRAMIGVHARLRAHGLRARMLVQVHDELLLEVPSAELEETAALVAREMTRAVELAVPLEVEVKSGPTWGDLRPLPRS